MDPYLEVFLIFAWLVATSVAIYLAAEKSLIGGLIMAVVFLVFPLGTLNKKDKEAKALQQQATHTCACSCALSDQESDSLRPKPLWRCE